MTCRRQVVDHLERNLSDVLQWCIVSNAPISAFRPTAVLEQSVRMAGGGIATLNPLDADLTLDMSYDNLTAKTHEGGILPLLVGC